MSRLVLTDPKEDDTVAYISFSMIKYPQIARLLIAVHFITANLKRLIDLDYGVGVSQAPFMAPDYGVPFELGKIRDGEPCMRISVWYRHIIMKLRQYCFFYGGYPRADC